jgi:hypothetical protein
MPKQLEEGARYVKHYRRSISMGRERAREQLQERKNRYYDK